MGLFWAYLHRHMELPWGKDLDADLSCIYMVGVELAGLELKRCGSGDVALSNASVATSCSQGVHLHLIPQRV